MRKSLILASCLLAGTSVMAMDTQYFVGAGAERGKIDMSGSLNIPDYNISKSMSSEGSDTALKIKMGVILNNTHRISLSHVKFAENDVDMRIILGNYDYLIPINNEFRVYAGIHTGQAKYEEDSFKMSGLAYGAQIGALYDITKNIEFELGLGYTKYNVDKTTNDSYLGVDYNVKAELDKSTSMFAGINYKF